jgi:hypothetical protein
MRMSASDQSSFPIFTNYVKHSLRQVLHVPLIVNNMKKFGSLSESELSTALSWNTDPSIVIVTLPPFGPAGCLADGLYEQDFPNQFKLSLGRVQDFEAGPMLATDLNARGEKVIIVGVIVLHELCHWGNFTHGVSEATEAGIAFCVATYGRRIPVFSRVEEMIITP